MLLHCPCADERSQEVSNQSIDRPIVIIRSLAISFVPVTSSVFMTECPFVCKMYLYRTVASRLTVNDLSPKSESFSSMMIVSSLL